MKMKKYDVSSKVNDWHGFYEWNKSVFYVNKKDERYQKFIDQKKEFGFTDEETWSLYDNIVLFVTPRLKRFIEIIEETGTYPASLTSSQEWLEILNKILFSFEKLFEISKNDVKVTDEDHEKIKEGLNLFGEWFLDLWW